MVAYSFKRLFAEDIRFGAKSQTVRGECRRHAFPGEQAQLYYGLRTRHARKILPEDPEVLAVEPVTLRFEPPCRLVAVTVDGEERDPRRFAQADGFRFRQIRMKGAWLGGKARWTHDPAMVMGAFWRYEHGGFFETWSGWLIRWQPPCAPDSHEVYREAFGEPIDPEHYRIEANVRAWNEPDERAVEDAAPDTAAGGAAK